MRKYSESTIPPPVFCCFAKNFYAINTGESRKRKKMKQSGTPTRRCATTTRAKKKALLLKFGSHVPATRSLLLDCCSTRSVVISWASERPDDSIHNARCGRLGYFVRVYWNGTKNSKDTTPCVRSKLHDECSISHSRVMCF